MSLTSIVLQYQNDIIINNIILILVVPSCIFSKELLSDPHNLYIINYNPNHAQIY